MKIRKNHFNLIEIVLTVAVIAFGVVVILGMLPKGLRAARNAGVESFATDVIDQMCNYLATSQSARSELNAFNNSINLADFDGLDYVSLLTGSKSGFNQVNVYGVASYPAEKGLYAIVRGEQVTVDSGETEAAIDFSGLLYVWRSSASYACVKASHTGSDSEKMHDCGKEGCRFSREKIDDSEKSVQINMELSYPLSLPYSERTKRYYSFEVSK